MKKLMMILMLSAMCSATSVFAQKPKKATSAATQCTAITKDGDRCKLEVQKDSKYCCVHNAKAKQCQATTKSGKRCKNKVLAGSKYCHVHSKK